MQLKLHEVATIFAVKDNVVHKWIRDNNLPVQVTNAQLRFSRVELVEWATLNHVPIPPTLMRAKNGVWPSDRFAHALAIGGVRADIPGANPEAVLRNIVAKLPGLRADEQDNLTALLLKREKMGSTAVGDGIAIPHPSCPVSLASGNAFATLCYLEHPLDFHAPDNQPVHALFILLTSNVRRHSLLIAELASALQDKEFRAAVKRHAPEAEILAHICRVGGVPCPVVEESAQLSGWAVD